MNESPNKPFREIAKEAWEKGCQTGHNLSIDRTELRKEVASRIRKCRLDARLTQEEVSEKIDANALTYKGYENCRSDVPAVYLVRIADFYGVSVDYLLGRTDNKCGLISEKTESASSDTDSRIKQLETMVEELKQMVAHLMNPQTGNS